MHIKDKPNQIVFDVSFIGWISYYIIFFLSTINEMVPINMHVHYLIILYVSLSSFLVIANSKYTKFEIINMMFLFLIGCIVLYFARSESVLLLFIFLCATKNIDYEVTFKRLYKTLIFICLIIIIFSVVGIIPNKESTGIVLQDRRVYLGFRHPNYCGTVFSNIIFLKIINTKAKFKIDDYLLIFLLEIINIIGPKSKTSLILGAFSILMVFVYNNINKRFFTNLFRTVNYMPIIFILLSISSVYGYSNGFSWANTLNKLFSTRIEQMAYYWKNYRLTMFGQILENVTSSQSNTLMQMRALDNGYLYILLGEGVIFTIEYIFMFIKSSKEFILHKQIEKLIVLGILLLQGLMETFIFRIEMMPVLLILADGIFKHYRPKRKLI